LNTRFEWHLPSIPCSNSIKNWVEKSGYSIYKEPDLKDTKEDYATIVDESMMIGSEKMLLTLGVKSDKTGGSALTVNDVNVLDISVKKSWNSHSIKEVFTITEDMLGKPPAYVVSDNASTISKAVRDKGYKHLRDVGHTLALFVEREYKNDASFNLFTKEIVAVKFREIMRPSAYLLPPKQRTIARFMNISSSINWANNLLKSFHKLNLEEKEIFRFIIAHAPLISELKILLEKINLVSKILKTKGISHDSIKLCLNEMEPLLHLPQKNIVAVAKACINYFIEEQDKLRDKKTVWHISSDIIESLFGRYKSRKSPNPLNGVTKQVLILPLMTKINAKTGNSTINFKSTLEKVFLSDLDTWKQDNLTDNLTLKRRKLLKAA
jgi:hypothetical protein